MTIPIQSQLGHGLAHTKEDPAQVPAVLIACTARQHRITGRTPGQMNESERAWHGVAARSYTFGRLGVEQGAVQSASMCLGLPARSAYTGHLTYYPVGLVCEREVSRAC